MSVPPSSGQTSSSPPGKSRPDDTGKNTKDFKLPDKKKPNDGISDDSKKKGLFDLAGQDLSIMEKQQNIKQEVVAQASKTEGVTATTAASQVQQIAKLVQNMVGEMRIGQVDGKNITSMDLKQGADVPGAFAGANLTLSYQANGLTIHFDNFMTPQQQNNAITLVEKNKEQLQNMMQSLQAKNIQVTELSIGTHTVTLPRIEALPSPIQLTPSLQAETEGRQQEREGREGGEGQGGPR